MNAVESAWLQTANNMGRNLARTGAWPIVLWGSDVYLPIVHNPAAHGHHRAPANEEAIQ